MLAVIVVGPDLLIRLAFADDVPDDGQDSMRNRQPCLFSPTARRYPPEQGSQEAVLLSRDRPGALRQNSSQISVALPCVTRVLLPGAFVIARTQPRPACQVSRIRKAAHVESNLRNDNSGGRELHSRNRAQAQHEIRVRLQLASEPLVDLLQFAVEVHQLL